MQSTSQRGILARAAISCRNWFDTSVTHEKRTATAHGTDYVRVVPFLLIHAVCLCVIWVGWSPVAVGVALGLYCIRMFAITGFYHRYFSHRTFKTSRVFQFIMALIGNSSVQRGALWWAAHHRHHHRHSDDAEDIHSPHTHGWYWSHMGWVTSHRAFATDYKAIPDLTKFKELMFLDRFDTLVPVALAFAMFGLGWWLGPAWGTSGWQMLVWGFFISTVVLFHATCTINSLAHLMGRKRFKTKDESRNSLLLALLTFGEGWHNNHHHCPGTVRQGFYWWEIDLTYYGLVVLKWLGVIWELNPIPKRVMNSARVTGAA